MIGKCHICRHLREISYCDVCRHWFCASCRARWFHRGAAAIGQLFGGRRPGCCGP